MYRIVLSYAVFGIEEQGGKVVEAAPIGAWMVGKSLEFVREWVKGKRGTIEPLNAKEIT